MEEEAKKAKVSTVRKKAEALPEIPDYERPELEVYEPNDFTPSTRDKPEKVRNTISYAILCDHQCFASVVKRMIE